MSLIHARPPTTRVFQGEVARSNSIGTFSRLISYETIGAIAATLDFSVIVAASVVSGVIYHEVVRDAPVSISALLAIGMNAAFLFVTLTMSRGAYRATALLSLRRQLGVTLSSWSLVLLLITALLFLLKTGASYSRGSTIALGLLVPILLLAVRLLAFEVLQRSVSRGTLCGPSAILIGDPNELASLSVGDLAREYGVREIGRVNLPVSTGIDTTPEIGVLESAMETAQMARADRIVLALRWDDPRRESIAERLRAVPLPVVLLPDQAVRHLLSVTGAEQDSRYSIELQRAPLSLAERAIKRLLDIAAGGMLLLALLPLLAIISVAIRSDSAGPVIFRQRRRGFNGREFMIYKFRTMNVLEDGPTIRQAQQGDERVTRVGRLLRTTSIDELPQLINVLRGEMSLVGPRPHAIAHDSEYGRLIANYAYRCHVKPGITGWAQVNGFRGQTAELELMKKRVDLDLWYVSNWSVWLDLWILVRTCHEVALRRNAH